MSYLSSMGLGDSFVLNEFMFCQDHGREYCSSCCCDYRAGNNYLVELDEETLQRCEGLFTTIDDRPALNAFALGAKLANKKEETYKCQKHGTVDCGDCYDWKRRIAQAIGVVEKLRGKGPEGRPGTSKPNKVNRIDVNDVD